MMTKAEAEKIIANVLQSLELSTGTLVDDVEITLIVGDYVVGLDGTRVDVSTTADDAQQLRRYVNITVHRLPGQHWGQADNE